MKIQCLKCKAKLTIPDDKASNPRLKLKCPRCGLMFPLAKAPRVVEAAARTAANPVHPTPAAPAAGAAAPRPAPAAPAAPARPETAATPSAPAAADPETGSTTAAAAADPVPAAPALTTDWTRCVNHPDVLSQRVCPQCFKGYCEQCGKQVQRATICPACEALCVARKQLEEDQAKAARRAIPMFQEIGTILRYPLSDMPAFVIITILILVFSVMDEIAIAPFKFAATLLVKGFRTAYVFHTVERVAYGERELSIPSIRDTVDLLRVLWLALAAFLVSQGPFYYFLVAFLGSGMSALADPSGGSVAAAVIGLLLLLVSIGWLIVYSPVALAVAALSHSFFETIKPWVGMNTIKRMGAVYWQAVVLFAGLMLVQLVITFVFRLIPLVGFLVPATTQVYIWLAAGCTVGLAMDKKAEDLGLA